MINFAQSLLLTSEKLIKILALTLATSATKNYEKNLSP